jgi:hypothetical protein
VSLLANHQLLRRHLGWIRFVKDVFPSRRNGGKPGVKFMQWWNFTEGGQLQHNMWLRVQNVSVQDGGRAIVGNVTQNAAVAMPSEAAPAPLGRADAKSAPVPRVSAGSTCAFVACGSKSVASGHRRNTRPMLSSPRCGARTRAGAAMSRSGSPRKRRCRRHGGSLGPGAPKGNQNASSTACSPRRRSTSAGKSVP